jgi:hypothetical protein
VQVLQWVLPVPEGVITTPVDGPAKLSREEEIIMTARSRRPQPRKIVRVTQADREKARVEVQREQGPGKRKSERERDMSREDRWITLPPHLALYPGEQAVINSDYVWTHRMDRPQSLADGGVMRVPVRPVCLGTTDVLTPKPKEESEVPPEETEKKNGRPRKTDAEVDDWIWELHEKGRSDREIAHILASEGIKVTPRTIRNRRAA